MSEKQIEMPSVEEIFGKRFPQAQLEEQNVKKIREPWDVIALQVNLVLREAEKLQAQERRLGYFKDDVHISEQGIVRYKGYTVGYATGWREA